MANRIFILPILRRLTGQFKRPLADEESVAAGYLFGSHARPESQAGSDIDLAAMNDAPVHLVHWILHEVVLVNEGDSSQRVAFEVEAGGEYVDLKPYLDQYRSGSSL